MPEPLRLKTTDLRREGLKVALKHVDRGGTVEIYHYKDLVALMVPPEGEEG